MSSTSLQAYEVMDLSASLMNDSAKSSYTYAAQIPYLNMALAELQEQFQLNNVAVTDQTTTSPITIPIGTVSINPIAGEGKGPPPNYPDDLVEVRGIFERLSGSTDSYISLTKKQSYVHNDITTNSLLFWVWESQRIKFLGANTEREVVIHYVKTLFPRIVDSSQSLGIINAKTYLMYKTAALCSHFIGENKTRSDELNGLATLAIDRAIGIGTKAKQGMNTRRRPFMSSYKRRLDG